MADKTWMAEWPDFEWEVDDWSVSFEVKDVPSLAEMERKWAREEFQSRNRVALLVETAIKDGVTTYEEFEQFVKNVIALTTMGLSLTEQHKRIIRPE